MEFKVK